MTGELQGHWEYVIAAYAVTWIFFGGYALSLWYRAAQKPESITPNAPMSPNGGKNE